MCHLVVSAIPVSGCSQGVWCAVTVMPSTKELDVWCNPQPTACETLACSLEAPTASSDSPLRWAQRLVGSREQVSPGTVTLDPAATDSRNIGHRYCLDARL